MPISCSLSIQEGVGGKLRGILFQHSTLRFHG